MVVMGFRRGFVAGTAITEIVALDDAGILKQPDRAIDGRNRDAVVDGGATPVKLLDIGMIVGGRQHPRDHAPLLGHLQPLIDAEFFQP